MKIRYISVPGETRADGRAVQKHVGEDFWYAGIRNGVLYAAVGDWASNLMGVKYRDAETAEALEQSSATEFNGGVIGAQVAKRVIAGCNLTGYPLVEEISRELAEKYRQLGLDASDPRHYIEKYGDAKGAYDMLRPFIRDQQKHQNTAGHPLSYAAINGTPVPEEGVKVLQEKTPKRALIFSDGYVWKHGMRIDDMERTLAHVYKVDPDRYGEYPAVGSLLDDRTALELHMSNWSRLDMERVEPTFRRVDEL